MDHEIRLRCTDGRSVALGTVVSVHESFELITRLTGGSSGQGRWSWLWGFLFSPSDPVSPEDAVRLAREAADLRGTLGEQLSDGAGELLNRIAGFVDARTRMLEQWGATIDAWLRGEDSLPDEVRRWSDSYSGRGVHAPMFDAMPEPFIGDWIRPKFVVLGLNPGVADPAFHCRCGHFTKQVAEVGYGEWAKADPYAGDLWELQNTVNKKNRFGRAVNRYRRARLEFARQWLGEPVCGPELLIVELYPWHSKRWDRSAFKASSCADVLRELVWEPLGELRVDHIFAFGKSWLKVVNQLSLTPALEFKPGEFHAKGRAGAVFELPASGKPLIVLWQPGYAGPPGERDTAQLRDLLGRTRATLDKPVE